MSRSIDRKRRREKTAKRGLRPRASPQHNYHLRETIASLNQSSANSRLNSRKSVRISRESADRSKQLSSGRLESLRRTSKPRKICSARGNRSATEWSSELRKRARNREAVKRWRKKRREQTEQIPEKIRNLRVAIAALEDHLAQLDQTIKVLRDLKMIAENS